MIKRDEKFLMESVLNDYEDELFEQEKIIAFKHAADQELKEQI
jgi:hypothetical protein